MSQQGQSSQCFSGSSLEFTKAWTSWQHKAAARSGFQEVGGNSQRALGHPHLGSLIPLKRSRSFLLLLSVWLFLSGMYSVSLRSGKCMSYSSPP